MWNLPGNAGAPVPPPTNDETTQRLLHLMTMMTNQIMRTPDQLLRDFQQFVAGIHRPIDANPSAPAMEELAREFDQFVSINGGGSSAAPAPAPAPPPAPIQEELVPPPFLEPMLNAHIRSVRNLMRHRAPGAHRHWRRRDEATARLSRMLDEQMRMPHHPMEMMAQALRVASHSRLAPLHQNMMHENNMRTDILLAYHRHAQRGAASSSATMSDDHTIAFVWDLDDMTMLSKRRMEKIVEKRPDVNATALSGLVDRILTGLAFSDPDEIGSRFVTNIEDAFGSEYTHARKYLDLKTLYTSIVNECPTRISRSLLEACGMTEQTEALCEIASKVQQIQHNRWKSVRKSLNLVTRKSNESPIHNYANVVLSKRGIPQAAAELLVSGNSSAIPIENIYSRFNMSKTLVWRRIQRRFGPNCSLIYITSSHRSSPKDINLRVAVVNDDSSIDYIYNAQRSALE